MECFLLWVPGVVAIKHKCINTWAFRLNLNLKNVLLLKTFPDPMSLGGFEISSLGKLSALRYESPSGPTAGLGKRISDHPTKWWYSCGRGLRNRAATVQSESRSPFALSLEDLGPLNLSCFPLFTPSSSLHTLVYLVAKITSLLAPSLQFRQYFLPRRTVQSTPPRSVSLRV